MVEFDTQNLANLAWAFTQMGRSEKLLFTALARQAEKCRGRFKAQGLANTAWAFAKVG